jgi:hypothetical protein
MVLNLVPGYHGTVVCTHRTAVRVCTHYSCISVSYESAHPGTVPWYGPYRTRPDYSCKFYSNTKFSTSRYTYGGVLLERAIWDLEVSSFHEIFLVYGLIFIADCTRVQSRETRLST